MSENDPEEQDEELPNEDDTEQEEAALAERAAADKARRILKFGSPPLSTSRQNERLYGSRQDDPVRETKAEDVVAPPLVPFKQEGSIHPYPSLEELGISRLVTRLSHKTQELKITVNGVGIRLPVIGYDLPAHALLCFVTGEVRCDLPRTHDVVVELQGTPRLTLTYLGQWHQLDWLPFQIVAFARKLEEEAL